VPPVHETRVAVPPPPRSPVPPPATSASLLRASAPQAPAAGPPPQSPVSSAPTAPCTYPLRLSCPWPRSPGRTARTKLNPAGIAHSDSCSPFTPRSIRFDCARRLRANDNVVSVAQPPRHPRLSAPSSAHCRRPLVLSAAALLRYGRLWRGFAVSDTPSPESMPHVTSHHLRSRHDSLLRELGLGLLASRMDTESPDTRIGHRTVRKPSCPENLQDRPPPTTITASCQRQHLSSLCAPTTAIRLATGSGFHPPPSTPLVHARKHTERSVQEPATRQRQQPLDGTATNAVQGRFASTIGGNPPKVARTVGEPVLQRVVDALPGSWSTQDAKERPDKPAG
jgi:hypothetical protein